jgi:hypothetical protein
MHLQLARYRFTFRMDAPLRLPDFAGSLLRGQFGASLRRIACMTGEKSCEGCPLRTTCPYPAIFESPAPPEHALQKFSQIPNPYVVEPPPFGRRVIASGETLQFCIVLVGRAVTQLPLISFALQKALAHGLGRERARGALETIDWLPDSSSQDAVTVWQQGEAAIAAHEANVCLPVISGVSELRLNLMTPMRLQNQGHPVRPAALTPRKLLADLLRRANLLFEFHADTQGVTGDVGPLVSQAEALLQEHELRWQDWARYSSRQQQEMTLGGVMGVWSLKGELDQLFPWLWLGQWLHVGKNATMGMGLYTLDQPV